MTFKISEFASVLNKRNGLAKTSHFAFNISPPMFLQKSGIKNDLRFLCDSASLPGISYITSDIRHYGIGISEKRPNTPIFTDCVTTFFGDGQGKVMEFFHIWTMNIINYNMTKGLNSIEYGSPVFFSNYPEHYVARATVYAYDSSGKNIIEYTLSDIYPLILSDVPMNWADENLMKIQVTFTYRTWSAKIVDTEKLDANNKTSVQLLQKLNRVDDRASSAYASTLRNELNPFVLDIKSVVDNYNY